MTNCWRWPIALLIVVFVLRADGQGEVLVRWDQDRVPPAASLGIASLVIPASRAPAIQDAVLKGYRVYLEVENGAISDAAVPRESLAGVVVTRSVVSGQLQELQRRLPTPARVLTVAEEGKWPHVRLNRVTLRNGVLQGSRASAQPWIESNGALVRIAERARAGGPPLLTYAWEPATVPGVHQGPALENYLVAIAEAGTFGSDIVLRLHEDFQRALLLGQPVARAEWQEIRRYLDFYGWDLPRHYQRVADIGVITRDAPGSFEILNLLTRHNVPFELIDPGELAGRALDGFAALVLLDAPEPRSLRSLTEFARRGGTVVVNGGVGGLRWDEATPLVKTDVHAAYRVGEGRVLERLQPVADPDEFALQVRDMLGPEGRMFDIWNGITIIAAPYREPGGGTLLLCAVNYAHEVASIQLRVRGTFAQVHYEAPESTAVLLPFRHRDGHTEFVIPDLRVGGRVFLSHARE